MIIEIFRVRYQIQYPSSRFPNVALHPVARFHVKNNGDIPGPRYYRLEAHSTRTGEGLPW